MDTKLRTSNAPSNANRAAGRLEAPLSGSLLSFVPVESGPNRAGPLCEELSRTLTDALGVAALLADFDARGYSPQPAGDGQQKMERSTWRALISAVDGLDVLDAPEFDGEQLGDLLACIRDHYSVTCANLTHARETAALEVLRASDGIFLVANSDTASLYQAREKAEWLRAAGLGDRCGLLLARDPKGIGPREAEDVTGVPVCSLVDTAEQLGQLATWLAAAHQVGAGGRQWEYPLAV